MNNEKGKRQNAGCRLAGRFAFFIFHFSFFLLALLVPPGRRDLQAADRPPLDLPVADRHANYGKGGSCGYAAAEDLLSLQGRDDLARYVRRHFAGGVMPSPGHGIRSLADLAESMGLDYDYSDRGGDEHWLQCASDRRLGAVVHWAEYDERGASNTAFTPRPFWASTPTASPGTSIPTTRRSSATGRGPSFSNLATQRRRRLHFRFETQGVIPCDP